MKVWVQLLHKKKELVEISEKSSLDEAYDAVSKVFNIEKSNNRTPVFLHYGHMLSGPQPFNTVEPDSRLVFYTEEKKNIQRLEEEEAIEPENASELEEEEEFYEIDETDTLFTQDDVERNLNNSVLTTAIEHFAENMQLNRVLDDNNTIFNQVDNLSEISEIISNNRSNLIPLVVQHQVHPAICSISEEDIFTRMSALLDITPDTEEDDELYAKLDQMTARQRSLVDHLCSNGYSIQEAVSALERTSYNFEAALNLLTPDVD